MWLLHIKPGIYSNSSIDMCIIYGQENVYGVKNVKWMKKTEICAYQLYKNMEDAQIKLNRLMNKKATYLRVSIFYYLDFGNLCAFLDEE